MSKRIQKRIQNRIYFYLTNRKWIKKPSDVISIIYECPEPQELKTDTIKCNYGDSPDQHDHKKSNSCTKIPSPPKSVESDDSLSSSRVRTRNPVSYTLPSLRSKLRKGKFKKISLRGPVYDFTINLNSPFK